MDCETDNGNYPDTPEFLPQVSSDKQIIQWLEQSRIGDNMDDLYTEQGIKD